jgi:hypothetical protein
MTYTQDDVGELRKALVGRSVVAVTLDKSNDWPGQVRLDNGTVLLLTGNDGCGGCQAGWYELVRLNDMPINGITNV